MTLIPVLIGYYVVLMLLGVLNFFVILHVVKYKYLGPKYKYILFVYFFILAFIIGLTQLFILKMDWNTTIVFPSLLNLSGLTGELINIPIKP
ncbi:MAG: hypothetical protein HQ530_03645 [Parcubacteria group bacterium]|nr:hypothetical protein [Parcubacteria group bacterium]